MKRIGLGPCSIDGCKNYIQVISLKLCSTHYVRLRTNGTVDARRPVGHTGPLSKIWKHGRRETPEYWAWRSMKLRCLNPKHKAYARYGGRGIRICDQWVNSFLAFLGSVGERPTPLHTLERLDNDGNYEPSNVTWATRSAQANNRCNNRMVTFNGLTMTTAAWADRIGVKKYLVRDRLRRGWSIERALTIRVAIIEGRAP